MRSQHSPSTQGAASTGSRCSPPPPPVCCCWLHATPACAVPDGTPSRPTTCRTAASYSSPSLPTIPQQQMEATLTSPTRQHNPLRLLAPRNNGQARLAAAGRPQMETGTARRLVQTRERDAWKVGPYGCARPTAQGRATRKCRPSQLLPSNTLPSHTESQGPHDRRSKGLVATIPARVTSPAFMQNTW